MNTHDIDTGLPHVAFCRVRDVDPHESHHRQLGVSADTKLYTEDQVCAAIEADRKRYERYKDSLFKKEREKLDNEWAALHGMMRDAKAYSKRMGEPVAYLRATDLERLAQPHVAGCAASIKKEPTDEFIPIFTTPQCHSLTLSQNIMSQPYLDSNVLALP